MTTITAETNFGGVEAWLVNNDEDAFYPQEIHYRPTGERLYELMAAGSSRHVTIAASARRVAWDSAQRAGYFPGRDFLDYDIDVLAFDGEIIQATFERN